MNNVVTGNNIIRGTEKKTRSRCCIPCFISSGDEELLSWFVVVQEETNNRRTPNKTKKRDNSPEPFRLALTFSSVEVAFILNPIG